MLADFEHCYRAVQSKDPRFDGWFFTAVTSTGIYCRPSCPALTPRRENVRFFPTAAAPVAAGYRSCLRCRPDAVPGSPEWATRADVVARAMRLIADGAVEDGGVLALAARLGYSSRQLNRLLMAEVGAGALALARTQRARTARLLIEGTDFSVAHIAFAAGFGSVRQCNDTMKDVFGIPPTEMRRRRRHTPASPGPGRAPTICLRLAHRRPIASRMLLDFLIARAVPGIEAGCNGTYLRSMRLPRASAVVEIAADGADVMARLSLEDLGDLAVAVNRCRRLLDLDSDPIAVDATLALDPVLRPLVESTPGIRVPGAIDGWELAVRAVVGQQVSVAGARTVTARLVAAAGRPRPVPDSAHPTGTAADVPLLFPSPDELLAAGPEALAMPASRRRALGALAQATSAGAIDLDAGTDPAETKERLVELPGIGQWTAAYIAMRALGDPDAFLPTDLGIRHAMARLGYTSTTGSKVAASVAEQWRPWRAYAAMHLWSSSAQQRIGATPGRRGTGRRETGRRGTGRRETGRRGTGRRGTGRRGTAA